MPEPGSVTHGYLITHHRRFARIAIDEARAVDPDVRVTRTSSPDVTLLAAVASESDLATAFSARRPIFIRHLAPVHVSVALTGERGDLDRIASLAASLPLPEADTFAVQCRKGRQTASGRHEDTAYTSRDIEIAVGMQVPNVFDLEQPQTVISIFVDNDRAHIGVSRARDNLTLYPDEARRPKAAPTVICRAEHKLREALEAFDLHLVPESNALDLGAAPGGWTYLLAEARLDVVAVDPAHLDPRVAAHPRVTHLRVRAETLELHEPFDLAVNDMGLDPDESSAILCAIAPLLAPSAPAIMTVKMPTLNARRWLRAATDVLEQAWEVESIRHLFHDRQEVTALLYRKS